MQIDFSFVNTGEDNVWETSLYTSKIEAHSRYFLISFINCIGIWFRSAIGKGHYHVQEVIQGKATFHIFC